MLFRLTLFMKVFQCYSWTFQTSHKLFNIFSSSSFFSVPNSSGLELIASKWAHSLIEFDLAWASVQKPLDDALRALADKRDESPLKWVSLFKLFIKWKFSSIFYFFLLLSHLNLCGSAVSVEAVKEILDYCQALNSINLSSCRGLPRGIKRLLQGKTALSELRKNLKNGD